MCEAGVAGAPCRLAAAGACSAPRGSILQCGAAHSYPGHRSRGAESRGERRSQLPLPPRSRTWVAFGNTLAHCYSDICGARVRSRVKMPLLQKGILQGLQGSNPKARFVSLWSITTCAVLQCHRGLADATVSSFPKWEHTAAFIILPLTRKICAEVDGPGHIILLCGTIPGAALLSLRVPSLKGAIQPRSK